MTGVLASAQDFSAGGVGTQKILVVSSEEVMVYCCPNGRPYTFLPIKGYAPLWVSKRSVADLSQTEEPALDDGELPSMPDSPDSPLSPPAPGSRDTLRHLPDGAPVSINGVEATALVDNGFYVQRSDRTFGIRVAPQKASISSMCWRDRSSMWSARWAHCPVNGA